MVRIVLVLVALGGSLAAQAAETKDEGPELFGDAGGRLWTWTAGERTWLTGEGTNLVLGGLRDKTLWGWASEGDSARFFTLELPKTEKMEPKKASPPPTPRFDRQVYPAPSLADALGDRRLLVWNRGSAGTRYEVHQGDRLLAARAWDDGRVVYAVALGPVQGWIVAGRSAHGEPWLEVDGRPVAPPEGWRGRLTVAVWVAEKKDEKAKAAPAPATQGSKPEKKPSEEPPVVHPWAAGWGAPESTHPQALLWGPDGWAQPDVPADFVPALYPVLGAAGEEGSPVLAGWQEVAGVTRPWFWTGADDKAAPTTDEPPPVSEGQIQAFSAGGKGGALLIVRHSSAPWFTVEDGKTSTPLEGLGEEDRVVAVGGEAKAKP